MEFDGEKFGTAKISPIFEQLQTKPASKSSLVALTGTPPQPQQKFRIKR